MSVDFLVDTTFVLVIAALAVFFASTAFFVGRVLLREYRMKRLLSYDDIFRSAAYEPDRARIRVSLIAFLVCFAVLATLKPITELLSVWQSMILG